MREVQQVGEALGARFNVSIDKRIQGPPISSATNHQPVRISAGRPLNRSLDDSSH